MSGVKKLIMVLMNCQGSEVTRYLRSSANVTAQYEIDHYLNYTAVDDFVKKATIHAAVSRADVLITQDVQNVEWLRNDELVKHIKRDCQFIRLAFWRFDGFWPIAMPQFTTSFWYPPIEIEGASNFDEYIAHQLPPAAIEQKFESEIEKFQDLDKSSDYKMTTFFLENYKYNQLFTDHWHPTAAFFLPICKYIISQLGLFPDIRLMPNSMINRDRYRLVLDCVHDRLNLCFDDTILRFYDHWVTKRIYFAFARSALPELTDTISTAIPAALFDEWAKQQGLSARPLNIATLGVAEQSSTSVWSHPHDAQRAVSGRHPEGYAFHTDLDYAPWWKIDLRNFHEIASIIVSNCTNLTERVLPLTISLSDNGHDWDRLAEIDFNFGSGSRSEGTPLRIDFNMPILSRHIKLQTGRRSYLHLDQVEVFCNVIGDI